MESLCTQDSENQQGVPEKSTFLKFQVYKSIWLFWTTLYPSKGLYWAIWIIWTVMDCWTISYNLFVWLVRNCHRDLWKILFLGHPVYERGVQIFYDPVFVTWSQVSATKCSRLAKIWGVTKNRYGHNFQNIGSKSAGCHSLWPNADSFSKRYFENCGRIGFLVHRKYAFFVVEKLG